MSGVGGGIEMEGGREERRKRGRVMKKKRKGEWKWCKNEGGKITNAWYEQVQLSTMSTYLAFHTGCNVEGTS